MADRDNENGPPREQHGDPGAADDQGRAPIIAGNAEPATPRYDESIAFLQWHAPQSPWVLVAIKPDDKKIEAMSWMPEQQDRANRALTWLRNVGGWANVYFGVNPIRNRIAKKPKNSDVAALAFLHVDIDPREGRDIAEEQGKILAKLEKHEPRPSCVILSGGGVQAFWRLREPFEINGEETLYEEAKLWNLQLERVLGGDHCHDVSRIMRLPGTVNRPDAKKRAKGRREAVARVEWMEDTAYELTQFEKAETVPSKRDSHKRTAVAASGDIDVAKLPVGDLCKRVIAQGCDPDDPTRFAKPGSTELDRSRALHYVCCELIRAGVDDDAIQAIITDPLNSISACVLDKPDAQAEAARQVEKAHVEVAKEPPLLDKEDPRRSARLFQRREMPHLMRHNGDWLNFSGAAYADLEAEAVRSRLYEFLDGALQRTAKDPVPFRPTTAKVNNVLDALEALAFVPADRHSPPCWLGQAGPPPCEIVACANGLLHLPTGELLPLTHEFFTRNALAIDYQPDAPPPTRWLQFLDELWPGDAGSIGTLQEMFGYWLVPDTSQQKIFLLVGPPRSGKGTIARVAGKLVGKQNTCAPTLESLGGEFGLQPLIGKQLAIVSDMRLGGRTDPAVVAENLLRISGEDMVTANRKHNPVWWSGRLAVRFLVMTNEIPKFADASGALASRFVPLVMSESFLGREDPGLANALMRELPGILCWAVEGWRRLRDRGHFVLPEPARDAMQTIADLAAPVSAFVRDECVLEAGAGVKTTDLFHRWRSWCEARGEHAGTEATFGRDLRANLPRVRTTRKRDDGGRTTFYVGIRLRERKQQPPEVKRHF